MRAYQPSFLKGSLQAIPMMTATSLIGANWSITPFPLFHLSIHSPMDLPSLGEWPTYLLWSCQRETSRDVPRGFQGHPLKTSALRPNATLQILRRVWKLENNRLVWITYSCLIEPAFHASVSVRGNMQLAIGELQWRAGANNARIHCILLCPFLIHIEKQREKLAVCSTYVHDTLRVSSDFNIQFAFH